MDVICLNDSKRVSQRIFKYFDSVIKKNEVSHAYLFSGSNSKLRRDTAYQTAALLNCQDAEKKPCGICSSCVKIFNNSHPDIIIIEPEGASIKISAVRELQKKLGYKKYEAEYKIVIIIDANKMTTEASNCLLKVLEEPLGPTVFLLLTENRQNLLPTIISRCQNIYLGLENNFEEMNEFQKYLPKIFNGDKYQALEVAAGFEKSHSNDIQIFLTNFLFWFRDLMIWKNTASKELLINKEWVETLDKYDICLKKCMFIMNKILDTQIMIENNANKQLALECLLLETIPNS
jgi:DNA polymerase-3 subunit delta'